MKKKPNEIEPEQAGVSNFSSAPFCNVLCCFGFCSTVDQTPRPYIEKALYNFSNSMIFFFYTGISNPIFLS